MTKVKDLEKLGTMLPSDWQPEDDISFISETPSTVFGDPGYVTSKDWKPEDDIFFILVPSPAIMFQKPLSGFYKVEKDGHEVIILTLEGHDDLFTMKDDGTYWFDPNYSQEDIIKWVFRAANRKKGRKS